MLKLFDIIVKKTNGKITYHLLTHFLVVLLIVIAMSIFL